MQANELRISNWVSQGGMPVRVDFNIIRLACLLTKNTYEGIPITPEILAKAGFTQIPNYQDTIFGLNGVHMILHRGEWQWNVFTRNKGVPYLHKLQNLYFALTGEELKIEL